MDFVQWIPLLSALGIGGAIVGWVGAGKSRREVRSTVLKALSETESKRWVLQSDYREFITALRELETAALVARIPRKAVQQYVVFADVARHLSDDSYEEFQGDEASGAGAILGYYGDRVRESAEILARLAWSPWWARRTLNRDLERVRSLVSGIERKSINDKLVLCQRLHGVLPGPIGQLPGIKSDPPMNRPEPFSYSYPGRQDRTSRA